MTAETGIKEAGIETAVSRELFWHAGLGDELVQSSLRGPSGVVDSDTVVTSYGYRNGEPYATEKEVPLQDPEGSIPVSINWLGTDPHGDVVYTVDADRNLEGMQSYDPWGVLRDDVGHKPHLGFQSDHTDADIGVVDMGARYYLPELGRFTTSDTYAGDFVDPISTNRYIYGGDDPVTMWDPDGHRQAPIGPAGFDEPEEPDQGDVSVAALRAYDVRSMVDYKLSRTALAIMWLEEVAEWFPGDWVPTECLTYSSNEQLSHCYWNAWHISSNTKRELLQDPSDDFVRTLTGKPSWDDLERSVSDTSLADLAEDIGNVAADVACVASAEVPGIVGGLVGARFGGPAGFAKGYQVGQKYGLAVVAGCFGRDAHEFSRR